jgi:NADP-dependent 3-hydroxy acid dehydrogenase YdfG
MDKSLIVITGASSGLGAAMAEAFSQAGYFLALLARNSESMQKLNLPNVICQSVDVTDYFSLKNAIEKIEEKFGFIDCLINNAGVVKRGDFIEVDHDEHEKMVMVNLQGVINCIEVVLPKMRERKAGTIINISSLADRTSRPEHAVYAASKAAVKSLTESLRMKNAAYGIRFCNIAPAKIHSPMWKNQDYDPAHFISAREFADVVLWVYQQPKTICIRDLVISPTDYEP